MSGVTSKGILAISSDYRFSNILGGTDCYFHFPYLFNMNKH
jgi:hypothetical protein